MKKTDIQFHGIGYGYVVGPAVNVKIRKQPTEDLARQVSASFEGKPDPRFTLAWIDQHISQDQQYEWWNDACQFAWEQLQNAVDANDVFGHPVTIISEGRSSGWAMIKGWTRETVEGWNAIDVARWVKFARFARETADDVPYQYLDLIYANVFQPWAKNQDEAEAHIAALKPEAVL